MSSQCGDQVGCRASSRSGVIFFASPPPPFTSQMLPSRSNAIVRPSGVGLQDAAAVRAVLTVLAVLAAFVSFVSFVFGRAALEVRLDRPAFRLAARSIIVASIAPASPPRAGRFDVQTAGISAARISSKSPSLLTLFGANSVMSTSPDQSSRCLISSQLRAPSDDDAPVRAPG